MKIGISDQITKLVRAEPGIHSRSELSRQFNVSRERVRQIVNQYELCLFIRERVSDQMEKLVRAEPGVYSRGELSRRFDVSYGQIMQVMYRRGLRQFIRKKEHPVRRKIEVIPEQQPETIKVIPEQKPETIGIHPVPIHTTRITVCPRCSAPLMLEQDHYGWYENCIFCGYNNDLYIDSEQSEHLTMVTSGGLV